MAAKESGRVNTSARRPKKSGTGRTAGKQGKKNKLDFKGIAASIISRISADDTKTSAVSSAKEAEIHTESVKSGKVGETLNTSQMEPYADAELQRAQHTSERRAKRSFEAVRRDKADKKGDGNVEVNDMTLATYFGQYAKKPWVRVMLAVMAVFLLIYIAYQVYLNFYSDIKTEVASISTYSETIDTEGIAVRDEIVIDKKVGGTAVNAVENGGKVSKDQTVINVFDSSGAAAAYTRIDEIENEIAELQSMATASEDSASEVSNIEKQLDVQINSLAQYVNEDDLSKVSEIKSNITYLMNKRLIAMRKVEDYQSRIDKLTKEKESLENSYNELPSKITAPTSGYYVNSLDGYEDLLNTSMLPELTAEKLESIMNKDVTVPENSAGKLITDFSWYLACPVSKKAAEDYLAVDSVYTLILPYSETGSIKGTLVYLNEGEGDELLAVFKCYSLLSELCTMRSQPVKIQIRSYTGFNVKKSALHVYHEEVEITDEDGKVTGHKEIRYPCVYVIVGNQVVARKVNVVYNGDKFAICSSQNSGSGYLALYDKVITEGKSLYVGKIIN